MQRTAFFLSSILAVTLLFHAWAMASTQAPPLAPAASNVELLQKSLSQAKAAFDTDFKSAMEQVAALIKQLDDAEAAQRPISAGEQAVFEEALLMEARGNVRVLKNDAARDDFRKLLRLNPNFSSDKTSPRENQILDDIRLNEMGTLEIQGQPQDANLMLNSQKIGTLQPMLQKWLLSPGHYVLSVEKGEFAPERREFDLAAKQTQSLSDIQLLRLNIPLVFLFNQAGVEVWINEKRIETSRPLSEALQSLSPPLTAYAQQQAATTGWDAKNISAALVPRFDISTPRDVAFKKDCFFTETRRINILVEALRKLNEQTPLWFDPNVSFLNLRPNQGILSVTSMPSPAVVTFDGQTLGNSPLQQTVCAGKHTVVVRTQREGHESPLELTNNATMNVRARLKPTLAVVTLSGDSNASSAGSAISEVPARLKSMLELFYVLPVDKTLFERELQRVNLKPELLVDAFRSLDSTGQPSQPVPGALQQVTRNLGASLLLLGFTGLAGGEGSETTWALLSIDSVPIDLVRLRGRSVDELMTDLKRLDEPAVVDDILVQSQLGFQTFDTRFPAAPLVVVKVWPATPAEVAGLRVGDIILSVDGAKMDSKTLATTVASASPEKRFLLEVLLNDGSRKTLPVATVKQPILWTRFRRSEKKFSNHLIARFQNAVEGQPASPSINLIRLNLAVAMMQGEQWAEAIRVLERTTGPLPGGATGRVSEATVYFLEGQCEEALGSKEKAVAWYQKAAESNCEWCMIDSMDSETASGAARRRLNVLKSTPTK